MAKITPTRDQVLIELDPFVKQSDGGLAIPDGAEEKPKTGTVVATGSGKVTKKGYHIPLTVKCNDRVVVPWATGNDIMISGKLFVLIRENDILGVLDSEE